MVGLYDGAFSYPAALRLRHVVDGTACNEKARQLHLRQFLEHADRLSRPEHSEAVIVGKVDHVVVGMQAHAADILLHGQSVTNKMADELFFAYVILPQPHRCRAPDVAIVCLYNVAHNPISKTVAAREQACLLVARLVLVEALFRAYQDGAVLGLAKRVAHHVIQDAVPAVGAETLRLRVET